MTFNMHQQMVEDSSSTYSPHNSNQEFHAAEPLIATSAIDAHRRGGGKRRASECLRPHTMIHGLSGHESTANTSLRRSENRSMPLLSYSTNGLKRNKSNELTSSQLSSQTFGLRRSFPRPTSQANATFDHVVPMPSAFQSNPVLGRMQKEPSLLSSLANKNYANESFHLMPRRTKNAILDRVMNAIHEESSSTTINKTTECLASSFLVSKEKAQSAPDLDTDVSSSTASVVPQEMKKQAQHDLECHKTNISGPQTNIGTDVHPQQTLISILHEAGYQAKSRKSSELTDYFFQYAEEHIAAYDQEVINAIRSRNIPLLRALKAKGKTLQCANRYGESLVHMACRRGMTDVVRFLVLEANVSLRVKDDYGRTPLHDACWSAEPNFELMDFLIEHEADLLLVEDTRGHFPFSYARRSHWEGWNQFLMRKRGSIRLRTFVEPLSTDADSSSIIG